MPAWGWICLIIGAFCFGWTLGADWLEDGGPFFGRWRGKPRPKDELPPPDVIDRPKPNRFCGLTGCELKRPHSHTEDLIRRIKNK